MSPTCSNRFLAGRKARSAAVRTISACFPESACRHSYGQPEEIFTRHQPISMPTRPSRGRRVLVLAAGLADVVVRDALPLVARPDRRPSPRSRSRFSLLGLRRARASARRMSSTRSARSSRSASRSPTSSTRGAPGERDLPLEPVARAGGGEQGRELALELRDLVAQRAARRALVDLDVGREQRLRRDRDALRGSRLARALEGSRRRGRAGRPSWRPSRASAARRRAARESRSAGSVAGVLRVLDRRLERHQPLAHHRRRSSSRTGPGAAVELDRGGGEEAAAAEHLALHVARARRR